MRRQVFVENFDDLGDTQFRRFVDGAFEISPESGEYLVPIDLTVGNTVELRFERRGEVILNIAAEIIF